MAMRLLQPAPGPSGPPVSTAAGPSWTGGLFVATVLLYVGGAVMFVVHARLRHEAGPRIGDVQHWFLDSSLGFVLLGPAVIVVVPALLRRLRSLPLAALLVGATFALVTTPGPVVHDHLVGAGTFGAALAEHVFRVDAAVATRPTVEHDAWSECLVQFVVGLPLYLALAYLAMRLARWARRRVPSTATYL